MKEICGNCKYHEYDSTTNDWICGNDQSECFADWTSYNYSCVDFEEKERE